MTKLLYNAEKGGPNEFTLIYLFDKKYNQKKKQVLEDIQNAIERKNRSHLKSESEEVFIQQESGDDLAKKKKKIDKHFLKTTLNMMYDAYLDLNKKEENSKTAEVLACTKNLMMSTMNKFTNNLVYDDINNKP